MQVAIFGLGYVGLTAAACLTRDGHMVVGVDPSEQKIREIGAGRSTISEPGVPELLQMAVQSGLLKTTNDARAARLETCDIAMVCVGTPSGPDGSHNMSYIAEVSRQIASALPPGRAEPLAVVYRSTMRPGSIDELIRPIFQSVLRDRVREVELVYNPEFLREATAIADYDAPSKIVVGTADGQPCKTLARLYEGISAPTFHTHYREAEFTKFADNTFHALKVAFANELGRVCMDAGVSAKVMHEIFVSDTKLNISPYYLRPGGAFGGSCLPKDVRALQHIASSIGANTPVIDALIRSNEAHKHHLFTYCTAGLAPGAKVLLLGLAFKKNSDDLRESPKVDLARRLLQAGYRLSIYDPALKPENLVGQNLGYAFSHLPSFPKLLIERAEAERSQFNLVIDTDRMSSDLSLNAEHVLDIGVLP